MFRSAAVGDTYRVRLLPAQSDQLVDKFHMYQEANGGFPRLETSEKMLQAYLYLLGAGGYFSSIGRPQGMPKSTTHFHIRAVVEFFFTVLSPHDIHLPLCNEYANMSMGTDGERHIILVVDGKLIIFV